MPNMNPELESQSVITLLRYLLSESSSDLFLSSVAYWNKLPNISIVIDTLVWFRIPRDSQLLRN